MPVLAFSACTARSDPQPPRQVGHSDAGINADRGLQRCGSEGDMNIPIIDSSIDAEDAMPDAVVEMADAAVNVDAGPSLD